MAQIIHSQTSPGASLIAEVDEMTRAGQILVASGRHADATALALAAAEKLHLAAVAGPEAGVAC